MASFVDPSSSSVYNQQSKTPLSPGQAATTNALHTLLKSSIETHILIEREQDQQKGTLEFDAMYSESEINNVINNDDDLERLLIARDNDIPKSTKMAMEMIRIRTKMNIMDMDPAVGFPVAIQQGNLRWSGYDKEGSPVLVCRAALWKPWDYKNGAEA